MESSVQDSEKIVFMFRYLVSLGRFGFFMKLVLYGKLTASGGFPNYRLKRDGVGDCGMNTL